MNKAVRMNEPATTTTHVIGVISLVRFKATTPRRSCRTMHDEARDLESER